MHLVPVTVYVDAKMAELIVDTHNKWVAYGTTPVDAYMAFNNDDDPLADQVSKGDADDLFEVSIALLGGLRRDSLSHDNERSQTPQPPYPRCTQCGQDLVTTKIVSQHHPDAGKWFRACPTHGTVYEIEAPEADG